MSKTINTDDRMIIGTSTGHAVFSPLYNDIVGMNTKEVCAEWIDYNKSMQKDYLVHKDDQGLFIYHTVRNKSYCSCHSETCCCPNDGVSVQSSSKRYNVLGNIEEGDFIRVDIRHVRGDIFVQ